MLVRSAMDLLVRAVFSAAIGLLAVGAASPAATIRSRVGVRL